MFVFRSVVLWLTLLFLALIGVASIVSWLYVVPPLKNRLVEQKVDSLRTSSALVTTPIEVGLQLSSGAPVYGERDIIPGGVGALDAQLNARVVIVDTFTNSVYADSRPGLALKLSEYPLLHDAIVHDRVVAGAVNVGGSTLAAVVVPVVGESFSFPNFPLRVVAAVLISSSLQDVNSSVLLVKRQILTATALAVAVTLVTAFLASLLISRRLKRIERGAEAIAAGDLGVTLKVRMRDEIGQLAATFNVMGGHLRKAFSAIEYEKKSAETMLNTLSEGVIGLSTEGRVLLHNPTAALLLGDALVTGATAEDVFPEEIASMWAQFHDDGTDEPVVFEHLGRTLEALTYPVGAGTDIDSIVVLRDVTQQARVERARRDFVANASHEFKTPLFSLSGFLELVDEHGVSSTERHEYLSLMKEQVERLQALSLSLLDLSQVDSGAVRIHPQQVDVVSLARSVAAEFRPRATERHLKVGVKAARENVVVTCDEERLAQVLRALLDNAVKFSSDGGRVDVAVAVNGSEASVSVSDRGDGIPPAELPHVFDRFYRGSMTRGSKSGTGLGLSIARDVTHLMGGTISAESRSGAGSVFTVTLPMNGPAAEAGPEESPAD